MTPENEQDDVRTVLLAGAGEGTLAAATRVTMALAARTNEVADLSRQLGELRALLIEEQQVRHAAANRLIAAEREVERLTERLGQVEHDRDAARRASVRDAQQLARVEGLLVAHRRAAASDRDRDAAARAHLTANAATLQPIAPPGFGSAWDVLRSDRALLSIWRHDEGEIVVVTEVERDVVKSAGEWVDLVRYVAQGDRRRYARPIDNFVARFALVLI